MDLPMLPPLCGPVSPAHCCNATRHPRGPPAKDCNGLKRVSTRRAHHGSVGGARKKEKGRDFTHAKSYGKEIETIDVRLPRPIISWSLPADFDAVLPLAEGVKVTADIKKQMVKPSFYYSFDLSTRCQPLKKRERKETKVDVHVLFKAGLITSGKNIFKLMFLKLCYKC